MCCIYFSHLSEKLVEKVARQLDFFKEVTLKLFSSYRFFINIHSVTAIAGAKSTGTFFTCSAYSSLAHNFAKL